VENAGGVIMKKDRECDNPYILYSDDPENCRYGIAATLDTDNRVLSFLQHYDVLISPEKARDCAVIIDLINQSLPAGGFSADQGCGLVYFTLTNDFADLSIGEEALTQMAMLPIKYMKQYEPLFAQFQYQEMSTGAFVAQLPTWEMPPADKDQETEQLFSDLQSLLERKNTDFIKDEEELSLQFRVKAGEKVTDMALCVDAGQKMLLAVSRLPMEVKPIRRVDMAVAVCSVTLQLNEGVFIYDIPNGEVYYKTTGFYAGGQIGDGHIEHMITCVAAMVDKYKELFSLLNEGRISLRSFLEQI
jgi:hypothetical protein